MDYPHGAIRDFSGFKKWYELAGGLVSGACPQQQTYFVDCDSTVESPKVRQEQLPMRGAFVIRLGPETEPPRRRFEGMVDEVDTGVQLRFRSAEDLLIFMGRHFEEALWPGEENRSVEKP